MRERLIEFLNKEQVSASRLAETIGVQASSISHILNGRNKPGFDFLVNLFTAYPKLNPKWLMMGVGSMYINEVKTTPMSEIIQETLKPQKQNAKEIEKVILFFSDNTFETYAKNS